MTNPRSQIGQRPSSEESQHQQQQQRRQPGIESDASANHPNDDDI